MKASTPTRERRLWDLIQEFEAYDHVGAASESAAAVARFRQVSGGRVATAASSAEARMFLFAAWGRMTRWLRIPYDALQIPETHRGVRVISPSLIAAAHHRGLVVHVWTVDERAAMDRLLVWGVDGIMSDRPDVLAEALAAWK